jgi:hypothetical protein
MAARVLPDEADHRADRVRIVGQRSRAARRVRRLPEWQRERGVRLEPGFHLRLGLGVDPGGTEHPHPAPTDRGLGYAALSSNRITAVT